MSKIEHSPDDLICPLCLKFIVQATVTACGHTYCYVCFQDLILVSPSCLKCDKSLRSNRITAGCLAIDSMVENLIMSLGKDDVTSLGTTQLSPVSTEDQIDFVRYEREDYVRRKKEYDDYIKDRVVNDLEVGDLVDVRTPEYVWCEGIVRRLIFKPETRLKVALIHYTGLPNCFDDEICLRSSRIARHKFFTDRQDIPKLSWTDRGVKQILYEGKELGYDLMGNVMDKYASLVDTDESDHYEDEEM